MATKVNYNTIKYTFSAIYFDASGLRLEAAVDLPEGAILKINSAGKLDICGASDTVAGVCRYPAAAGAQAVCETKCVINNKGTSLSLTPGTTVFAAAAGGVSGTGTNKVGVAIGPDEIFVNV